MLVCAFIFSALQGEASERLLESQKKEGQYQSPFEVSLKAKHRAVIPSRWDYELSSYQNYLLDKIIIAESGWDPEAENPDSTASGYCQFLDSTERYVQNKWEMEINFEDPEQQLYACRRLFDEEGTRHWLASKHIWGKYVR